MIGTLTVGTIWHKEPNAENIYIGREAKGNSLLHNPYRIDANHNRADACKAFNVYLKKELKNKQSIVRKEMLRIRSLLLAGTNVNLQCFCTHKELQCHGQEIEKVIIQSLK